MSTQRVLVTSAMLALQFEDIVRQVVERARNGLGRLEELRALVAPVRSRVRSGNAADVTRTSRAFRGCAGKAHDHRRRNVSRRGQGQPQHRHRG